MPQRHQLARRSNLWLAETLWKLGAVQFGSFTLGRTTVDSPLSGPRCRRKLGGLTHPAG